MDKYEAHKGAITNAMKKCASMFGIASDIYKGLADPDLIENGQAVEMPEVQVEYKGEAKIDGGLVFTKEEPLPIGEKGDIFSQLLTELNSVQDKETFVKAKEMMDRDSKELTEEQISVVINTIVELEKKFGK